MRQLTILKADFDNPDHAAAVLELTDDYAKDDMGLRKPLPQKTRETLVEGLKSFPDTLTFLAFVDEKPAGIANCFYGFSTFHAKRVINIHDIAVKNDYRSMGIGHALLGTVEKQARQEGCQKLTLEVREDNRARNLYERFGFTYGEPRVFFMQKAL